MSMHSPAEWIAELDRYATAAASMRLRDRRILRAQLDGAWGRLQGAEHPEMIAAVERANERLPEVEKLGFWDSRTGDWVGVPRAIRPIGHSP